MSRLSNNIGFLPILPPLIDEEPETCEFLFFLERFQSDAQDECDTYAEWVLEDKIYRDNRWFLCTIHKESVEKWLKLGNLL